MYVREASFVEGQTFQADVESCATVRIVIILGRESFSFQSPLLTIITACQEHSNSLQIHLLSIDMVNDG